MILKLSEFNDSYSTPLANRKTFTWSPSFKEKLATYKKFEQIPPNSASCRHRNRCWVTGRSRGFYRDFGLSRHVLREMAHEGSIPGLKKSSW